MSEEEGGKGVRLGVKWRCLIGVRRRRKRKRTEWRGECGPRGLKVIE